MGQIRGVFGFLVGSTLGLHQVGLFEDEIVLRACIPTTEHYFVIRLIFGGIMHDSRTIFFYDSEDMVLVAGGHYHKQV